MDNNRDFDREIERIRAIENTKEYQDRLNLLRNQMSIFSNFYYCTI